MEITNIQKLIHSGNFSDLLIGLTLADQYSLIPELFSNPYPYIEQRYSKGGYLVVAKQEVLFVSIVGLEMALPESRNRWKDCFKNCPEQVIYL